MKATQTHVSPISEFRIRYDLHPGLADAHRMNDPDYGETFPATRAQLAFALDWMEYKNIELAGSYGSAGCYLVAVMGDGEGEVRIATDADHDDGDITEARAEELLTEDGSVDADDVHGLHGSVWDGHNHVPFVPSRALAWLSEEDSWRRISDHRLVQFDSDGAWIDGRCDEGWELAAWDYGLLGNDSCMFECRSAKQVEEILGSFGIPFDRADVSDDDVEFLVPVDKLAVAARVLAEGLTLDELEAEARSDREDELADQEEETGE